MCDVTDYAFIIWVAGVTIAAFWIGYWMGR